VLRSPSPSAIKSSRPTTRLSCSATISADDEDRETHSRTKKVGNKKKERTGSDWNRRSKEYTLVGQVILTTLDAKKVRRKNWLIDFWPLALDRPFGDRVRTPGTCQPHRAGSLGKKALA
jgi:hypothetical protein